MKIQERKTIVSIIYKKSAENGRKVYKSWLSCYKFQVSRRELIGRNNERSILYFMNSKRGVYWKYELIKEKKKEAEK